MDAWLDAGGLRLARLGPHGLALRPGSEDTERPEDPNHTIRITYNIPLVDFTWANGAMELLPGSHLQPRSFLSSTFHDIAHLYPVSLRLQRGDALLRDSNTVHRGTPNLTEHPRPMLDQTYRTKRQPG